MKQVLFVAISLMFAMGSHAQEDVFDKQNALIIKKNRIKSQTLWNYAVKDGVVATDGYKNVYSSYDEIGNQTEVIKYKNTGAIFMMESYKYDSNNYNTGYVRYDGSRSQITYKKVFKYDGKGNKLIEAGFDGQANYKTTYEYNAKNMLEKINYLTGDVPYQVRDFVYIPDNSRLINVYNAEGKFQFKMQQKLDARGNILEDIEFKPDNQTQVKKYLFKYDASNNILEEVKYEMENFSYKKLSTYDANGRLAKITQQDADGTIYDISKYEYDAGGKLVKEFYRKKNLQEFSLKSYTYDAKSICTEVECFYASYNYKVLFKYTYEFL